MPSTNKIEHPLGPVSAASGKIAQKESLPKNSLQKDAGDFPIEASGNSNGNSQTLSPEFFYYTQNGTEDERLFAQFFDELGEAVLISDHTGRILRANKAAVRILGIPVDKLTTLKHDDPIWQAILDDGTAVPTSDLPAVRALREKKPVSGLEIGVIRPDGKLTWILESAAPLLNEQGEVTGVIVTFPEVTAAVKQRQTLKELSEKYQRERDRANEANRLKSAFLANMSHEIRTPMTAILGFSDVLASELASKVSEQHYTFLRSINVSGKRLLNLINDILDLSKIESGRLEMEGKDLDVATEIDSAITPLAWVAKQKSLTMHVQNYPERLNIYADRQRLGQVLTNIISNAIKFTKSGSNTVRMLLVSEHSPGEPQRVAIEIEDTGIGISKEFLPFIFDEFRQEHAGATKEYGGTGLGLAISRRLVSLMEGTLHVRSEQGVGTTFTITLPLSVPGAHDTEVKSDVVETSGDVLTTPPALVSKPVRRSSTERHILVVEDNIETQRLIDVYLKSTYRVSQAANAQEVFEVLYQDMPDLIIMDINLPGKDGLAITREIRKGALCPQIPIIALTAFAMTGDRQRCIDAGCTDYLSKPATKKEVLAAIAKNLENKNA